MSPNESPLSLLQECIVAGGASEMNVSTQMQPMRCQPKSNEESPSSAVNIFMEVLRSKASTMQPYFASNDTATAHSALRQDFNRSAKVWGVASRS